MPDGTPGGQEILLTGHKRGPNTPEHNDKISEAKRGIRSGPMSRERRKAISVARLLQEKKKREEQQTQ